MPPVQTTYASTLALGYAGMLANTIPATLISRNVETGAGIGFGLAVSQGSDDGGVVAFTDNVVGITVRERSVEAGVDLFSQNETARVMTKGALVVTASGAVAAGDAVHAVAGGALANSGGTVIPGARWDSSAADGELAVVRLG